MSFRVFPGGYVRRGSSGFFFSSRRRHTSLTCDWSSDVCSSDLGLDAERVTGSERHGVAGDHVRVFVGLGADPEIGRASCRERVEMLVVAGAVNKKSLRRARVMRLA